jgi:hypothetical protein
VLEVRKDVGDDPTVLAQRGAEVFPEGLEALLALGQQGVDEVPEGLDERDIRLGALKLVEFSGAEISAMPKSMRRTRRSWRSTRMLKGLMSLWMM